jgi:hypothetical protein
VQFNDVKVQCELCEGTRVTIDELRKTDGVVGALEIIFCCLGPCENKTKIRFVDYQSARHPEVVLYSELINE